MIDELFADKIVILNIKGDFMKRIASFLLVFAIIFSFTACGKNKSETDNNAPPVIQDTVHTRNFTDESGKTVIKVKVTLPQIVDNCDEKIKNHINTLALEEFKKACGFAESNIENASSFMKSMNSDKPWSKTVTFESTLVDSRYACFIVKESLSYFDSETNPLWRTVCYDVKTGAECTLSDFATIPEESETCFEAFLSDVLAPALPMRFTNPSYLTEETYEKLSEIVSPQNFYLTENGLGVYFNKNDVHEYLSGTFKITFTWNELAAVYALPEK